MWKEFYEGNELLSLPLFAMGFFFVAFVASVTRAWLKHGGTDPSAQLPLQHDASIEARSDA